MSELTPREAEIGLALLAGETSKEIAVRLWISRETVKTHVRRLLAKSGYHSIWEMRFSEALKERDAEIARLRGLLEREENAYTRWAKETMRSWWEAVMDRLEEIEKRWINLAGYCIGAEANSGIAQAFALVNEVPWLVAEVKRLRRELALYLADEEE